MKTVYLVHFVLVPSIDSNGYIKSVAKCGRFPTTNNTPLFPFYFYITFGCVVAVVPFAFGKILRNLLMVMGHDKIVTFLMNKKKRDIFIRVEMRRNKITRLFLKKNRLNITLHWTKFYNGFKLNNVLFMDRMCAVSSLETIKQLE